MLTANSRRLIFMPNPRRIACRPLRCELSYAQADSDGTAISLNPKHSGFPCRSSRIIEQARTWLAQHPQVRYVDLLLPDQMGIPRGKRVTVSRARGHLRCERAAAAGSMFALDVLGGTIQATGLGFRRGRCGPPCLPLPGLAAAGAVARASRSRRCRSPCTSTIAARSSATRATCSSIVLARFTARGLTPVMAVELEFYFVDRERTARGPRAAAAPAASGRREDKTQINSMAELDEYSVLLRDIDAAARAQDLPAGTVLAEYGPGQFEVNLHHVADALPPATTRSASSGS
jgi:glutamine synthetase